MGGRERAREKTKKGREGWTQGSREEEEGNSYIKILKMYECI